VEEAFAICIVINQTAVGDGRVVVDQHLADVEDDVVYLRHCEVLRDLLVAAGIAASIAFFMTEGKASLKSVSGRDHHQSCGMFSSTQSALNTSSRNSKCVNTCLMVLAYCQSPSNGAAVALVSPSWRA